MSTAPTVVLAVDDHPLIRSALREIVSCVGAGCTELLEAGDPAEGLALLAQRHDIDLVFLDLSFGGDDGLDYVERYRATAALVPLIIYTMHEDAATLAQALARGAAGAGLRGERRHNRPAVEDPRASRAGHAEQADRAQARARSEHREEPAHHGVRRARRFQSHAGRNGRARAGGAEIEIGL